MFSDTFLTFTIHKGEIVHYQSDNITEISDLTSQIGHSAFDLLPIYTFVGSAKSLESFGYSLIP